ncbi:MAG TPA: YigZ family protein [Chitinophagaceae bacterium]|nr:YigZ family protein [Chitinophagaceae bacterium]
MSASYYYTIERSANAEFKDRGSKFIAFAFPITNTKDFKKRLVELKEEHPKAVHHCFAYRLGTDGNNFRSSDDGEPSGTAGKPILGQIDGKELTDVAVVIVRYFGGTLLGVPGLINAYKTATSLALQTTPIIQKAIETHYHLQFDYTKMNEVMMIVKKHHCSIVKKETELFCQMEIGIPKANLELVLLKLKEIYGIEMKKTDLKS